MLSLNTHSTRTMMMNKHRSNSTAKMAATAMGAIDVSCIPAEVAWVVGSTVGAGVVLIGATYGVVLVGTMYGKNAADAHTRKWSPISK